MDYRWTRRRPTARHRPTCPSIGNIWCRGRRCIATPLRRWAAV